MKRIFSIQSFVLLGATLWAQSPEKMSYQAVIRDASNNLIIEQIIGMQITILQGSASGTAVYVEKQNPTSNANGLVSIEIGTGTMVIGDLKAVDWVNGPYFLKTEIDPTGGTSYTITGTSQLLSVPYAFHAKTAEAVTGSISEIDPVFNSSIVSGITAADTNNWNHKQDQLFAGKGIRVSGNTISSSIGSFYLGKDTLGGIVYYIYIGSDGQQHGLIVSKEETQVSWQNTATNTPSSQTWAGALNMYWMTDSPAKDWITTNYSSEWYLPSIDELSILWQNRYHVNKELFRAEGTLTMLSNSATYWSSTQISGDNAFCFSFHHGSVDEDSKTKAFNVRAIRTF